MVGSFNRFACSAGLNRNGSPRRRGPPNFDHTISYGGAIRAGVKNDTKAPPSFQEKRN
jgi:hypothetical protein